MTATLPQLLAYSRNVQLKVYRTLREVVARLTLERSTWRGGAIFDPALGVPRRRHAWEHPEDSAVALLRLAQRCEEASDVLTKLADAARIRASDLIAANMDH